MPRKRRHAKVRHVLPVGLDQITLTERAFWSTYGPLVGDEAPKLEAGAPYHVWPDWATWAAFYGAVRGELFCHPSLRERSVCEAMYAAFCDGEDPEQVRAAMLAERAANDPRLLLEG